MRPRSYNLLNAVVARAQAGGGYASTYAASSYDKSEHEAVARSQLWPSITGGWHARGDHDEMLAMVATRYPDGTLSTAPIGSLRNMLEVSSTFTDRRASASASRHTVKRAREREPSRSSSAAAALRVGLRGRRAGPAAGDCARRATHCHCGRTSSTLEAQQGLSHGGRARQREP